MSESWISSIATPSDDVALRREQARRVLVDDAQLHTRVLLRNHSSTMAERSSGLADFLTSWADCETVSYAEAFGIPIAQECWRAPDVDPVWTAASSALHLARAGRLSSWEATFYQPLPVRVGSVQTDAVRTVRAEHDRIHFIRPDGSTVSCPLPGEPAPPIGRQLDRVQVGRANLLILTRAQSLNFPPLGVEEDIVDSTHPPDDIRRALEHALACLRQATPSYFDWVVEAVHTIIPTMPPTENGYSSGSSTARPGVVHISFPISHAILMESLVHEASHQYFHIGQLETLFGNGKDERLYLNPYIERERPIERILIAFHAFGNIALFYRSYLATAVGEEAERIRHDLAIHFDRLRAWERALAASNGLTGDGRVLFETTRQRLFG